MEAHSNERMLLGPSDGKLIAESLMIAEVEVEIARAVHQVQKSLTAQEELREEASDLDSTVKKTRATR